MALTPPITFDQSTYLEGLYGPSNISPVLPVTYNPITYDLGVNSATSATSGIVSAGAQNFGGDKTFDNDVTVTGSLNLSTVDLTSISNPQLTIGYDSTNNATLGVDSVGNLSIDASGNNVNFDSTDIVNVKNTDDASSTTTGSLVVSGGAGLAKNLWVGGELHSSSATHVLNAPQLTLAYEEALTNKATLSVDSGGKLMIDSSGDEITTSDVVKLTNASSATSQTDGALVVTGGAGFGGALYSGVATHIAPSNQLVLGRQAGLTETGTIHVATPGILQFTASNGKVQVLSASNFYVNSNTWASDITTASAVFSGGIAVTRNLLVNQGARINYGVGGTPQLTIGYDTDNKTEFTTTSTGDLTINTSGNDLNFHSTDTVKILNTTAATSTTTGALIDSGGLGVADSLWVGNGGHFVNSGTQLTLANEVAETNKTTLSVSATGDLTIDTSGNDINLASTDKVHVLNVTEVGSSTAALTVDGGLFTSKGVEVTGHTLSQSGAIVANKFSTALMHMTYRVSTDAEVAILPTPTAVGACVITNGKLDLTGGSNQYLRYDGTTNLATLTNIATVRCKYTPNYSGTPATIQFIFGCGNGNNYNNYFDFVHNTSNVLGATMRSGDGTVIVTGGGGWNPPPVAGTEYDIELGIDIIHGVFRVFLNGTLLREQIWAPTGTTRDASPYCYVGTSAAFPSGQAPNFSIRDLIILPSIVNTGAYGSAWYSPGIDVSGVAISRALLNTGRATISGSTKLLDSLYVSNGGHFANSGTQLTLANEAAETNTATLSVDSGGILTIDSSGSQITTPDVVKITNATNSTSTTTGALQVSGGASVVNDLYVGGTIHGSISSTSMTSAIGRFTDAYVGEEETFYSSFLKDLYPDIAIVKTVNTSGSPVITSNSLDLTGGLAVRYVQYDAETNLASLINTITWRYNYIPNYTGTPATNQYMLSCGEGSTTQNLILLYHGADGKLHLSVNDKLGTTTVGVDSTSAWSPTAGTSYEIEMAFNTVNSESYIFVDGTLVGYKWDVSISRTSSSTNFYLGVPSNNVASTDYANFYLNNLKIFSSVIHTDTYVPENSSNLFTSGLTNTGDLLIRGNSIIGGTLSSGASRTSSLTVTDEAEIDTLSVVNNATVDGTLHSGQLVVTNAGSQLRLNYEEAGTNYASFSADSSGLSMGTSGGITSCSDVFNFTDTTDSSDTASGCIVSSGGLGLAKNLNVGGATHITSTTDSSSTSTGALICDGGGAFVKNLYVGGNIITTGSLTSGGNNVVVLTSATVSSTFFGPWDGLGVTVDVTYHALYKEVTCHIPEIKATATSSSTATITGNVIPEAYRPPANTYKTIAVYDAGGVNGYGMMLIGPAGDITIGVTKNFNQPLMAFSTGTDVGWSDLVVQWRIA